MSRRGRTASTPLSAAVDVRPVSSICLASAASTTPSPASARIVNERTSRMLFLARKSSPDVLEIMARRSATSRPTHASQTLKARATTTAPPMIAMTNLSRKFDDIRDNIGAHLRAAARAALPTGG